MTKIIDAPSWTVKPAPKTPAPAWRPQQLPVPAPRTTVAPRPRPIALPMPAPRPPVIPIPPRPTPPMPRPTVTAPQRRRPSSVAPGPRRTQQQHPEPGMGALLNPFLGLGVLVSDLLDIFTLRFLWGPFVSVLPKRTTRPARGRALLYYTIPVEYTLLVQQSLAQMGVEIYAEQRDLGKHSTRQNTFVFSVSAYHIKRVRSVLYRNNIDFQEKK